ncbi:MAG: hypothetical protein JXM70_27900, partial [Pirellulales bacterium]|nr:hypothetical protein [Pirellulales bacterium]
RDVGKAWEALTGVRYTPLAQDGRPAPGFQVTFSGKLSKVKPFNVVTELLPDRVYPLQMLDAEPVARSGKWIVGAHRKLGRGSVTTLGFRPRDDQSASLGRDVKTWFEILLALGVYPSSGRYVGINDNTEVISRSGDLFTCRFPNGAISIAPHLKNVEEQWPGGFHRDAESDAKIMARVKLPDDQMSLDKFKVEGHEVTYSGRHAVTFRMNQTGNLIGFAGQQCDRIEVDGRTYVFADKIMPLVSWAPVPKEQSVADGAVYLVFANGAGELSLPIPGLKNPKVLLQGVRMGEADEEIKAEYASGMLKFPVKGDGKWYFVCDCSGG